jgi:hypothetical protein
MERGLVTLIGMSIAYAASLLGLGLAWYAYRKRTGSGGGGASGTASVDRAKGE